MPLPRIAIVGRPNVGKSSLLNMLARAKVSIVDSVPGVTRDRVTTIIELEGPLKTEEPKLAEITDTGGYGVYTADGARYDDAGEDLARLTGEIERQIAEAVDRSDLILFVIDAQAGVTALDEVVARLLRERGAGQKGGGGARVQVVANKVDAEHWEAHAADASSLGFGEAWPVSAQTKHLRRVFRERLFEAIPYATPEDRQRTAPEMRLALVGRRNAGKSSFVNALAGEERCIVSEIAGTTRDSIDVRFEVGGRSCIAIDTAGVRKRARFADRVEHWAFERCRASIQRADVVLLLIDSTEKVSAVDKRLGASVMEAFKPCVVVVTKWDLTEGRKNRRGKPISPADYQAYLEKEIPGMSFCPIVFTSSETGQGLAAAVEVSFELYEQASARVPTGRLNTVFKEILAQRGPTSRLGTQAKILYVSQVSVRPPTLVLVVNDPKLFQGGPYERYLLNRLREELPFTEVPIRLLFRERKRARLGDLLSGRHAAARAAVEGPDVSPNVDGIDGAEGIDAEK